MRNCSHIQAMFVTSILLITGCTDVREPLPFETGVYDTPIDYQFYTQPAGVNKANDTLGRLSLAVQGASLRGKILKDQYKILVNKDLRSNTLPAFDFDFVISDGAVIPLIRGAVYNEHPLWEWVLEPGVAWEEQGSTRISLPFALKEKGENCLHNGVLLADISSGKAMLQIGVETCMYNQFDMWGLIEATWSDEEIAEAEEYRSKYEMEVAARLPVKPISALADRYPELKIEVFKEAGVINPSDLTTYGVVHDGIHYRGACNTRYGDYPYCDVMSLPSYSLAKSLMGGLGAFMLEKRYPDTLERKVSDLIPACASNPIWQGVTLADLANLTTGNYNSPETEADEMSASIVPLFLELGHAGKLEYACNAFTRQQQPGEHFVYHTSDIYLLGTALNAVLQEYEGAGADFYRDLIVKDVWEPLGLDAQVAWTSRTYDDAAQPFTGWGLILHGNDMAKISSWLADRHDVLKPSAVFDMASFNSALQKDNTDRGLPHSRGDLHMRYKFTFWGIDFGAYNDCETSYWLPRMSGYGGISVVMLPNGTTFYNVADGGTHASIASLKELNKIELMCERASELRQGEAP